MLYGATILSNELNWESRITNDCRYKVLTKRNVILQAENHNSL